MWSNKMNYQFVKCEDCNGEGWIFDYSYYANPMPKETKHTCLNCNGQGKLVVIPNGFNTIRESEIKNG